ncbi:t-SNARE complex subunit (syntaxin) [Paenibacillus anaericanus]|uniref:hemolysin XhlA family protein n=1 Tax=Paenibacillus anaericanus TaxID=170367 RepID=UPI00278151E8|nr:hemolysin XhlA family protein [Paenibacillus anaericanus]MDQ0090195.1 t-SNARE complex subunit (syntaxin) [Paenibacillus anaericanus]
MPDPQLETLQRVTRVETKVDNIEEKLDSAINARELAVEAISSAKSAHERIDKIDKTIFWLVTTVIGAVILAIIKIAIEGRG